MSTNLTPSYIPQDPLLRTMLFKLLPISARPWTTDDLCSLLHIRVAQADQLETALIESGVLLVLDSGYCLVQEGVRDALLIDMINRGELERAQQIIVGWYGMAAMAGDLHLMGRCQEHLSNVLVLQRQEQSAIATLVCALQLYELAGDQVLIIHTSWSLGIYAIRHGDQRGMQLIERAIDLAEQLRLPEAARYRRRLRRVLAQFNQVLKNPSSYER